MSGQLLTLEPGSRFWFEGQAWEVVCFDGDQARLRYGSTVRSVSTSALLGAATPLDDLGDSAEQELLPTVALSALTARQRREVDRKIADLQPLLSPVPDGASRSEQVAAHAAALGLSPRTLERRLDRFATWTGRSGGRTPAEGHQASCGCPLGRACLEVLDAYVPQSTPTRKTVISRVNAAFLAAVPGGRLPSASVAYLR